jgi:hypothetical protein
MRNEPAACAHSRAHRAVWNRSVGIDWKTGSLQLVRSRPSRLLKSAAHRLPVAWTDAEAEPRPTNANARLAIVVAVAVVSPRPIITVPDDHATIAPGMPALACVVTNQSCLVKQRRAVSDLNLVGGISARGYEGTGAGEECQCQFSHVHFLSVEAPSSQWEAPTANVSTKGTVPTKLALVIDMNRTLDGTVRAKMFPIGNVASEPSSSLILSRSRKFCVCRNRLSDRLHSQSRRI